MNITHHPYVSTSHLISLYMTQKGMEEAPKLLRSPSFKLNIKLGWFNHLKGWKPPSTNALNPTPHTKHFYKEKSQCGGSTYFLHLSNHRGREAYRAASAERKVECQSLL
jgi:hypothetical protein